MKQKIQVAVVINSMGFWRAHGELPKNANDKNPCDRSLSMAEIMKDFPTHNPWRVVWVDFEVDAPPEHNTSMVLGEILTPPSGGSGGTPAPRRQWEYDTTTCDMGDVQEYCEAAGRDGWELVSTNVLPMNVMLIFKRPKEV